MESSQNFLPLFCKFSNGVNILPFFGGYEQGKLLMELLGKATNSAWKENYDQFKLDYRFKCIIQFMNSKKDKISLVKLFKENNRMLRYLIKVDLKSPTQCLEMIDVLDSIDDVVNFQICSIMIGREIFESKEFLKLVDYLREREPSIPIPVPIGFKDQRLRNNPWSIFFGLTHIFEDYEFDEDSELKRTLIVSENDLDECLSDHGLKTRELEFYEKDCETLLNSDVSKRAFISQFVTTLSFSYFHSFSNLPVEVLKFVTNGDFEDEKSKDKRPLFDVQKVNLDFYNTGSESIKGAMDVLEFKRDLNHKIQESIKPSTQKPLCKVNITISTEDSYSIYAYKSNCFVFICIGKQSYGVSGDADFLIDCYDKVLYSDESLYVLRDFVKIHLHDADLVSPDHHAHKRFEELLVNFYQKVSNVPSYFGAFFNYGFDTMHLYGYHGEAFPSFKDVQYTKIANVVLGDQTIEFIKEIADQTTYLYNPRNNRVQKKSNSGQFNVSPINLSGKGILAEIEEGNIDLLSSLPIFSFELYETYRSPNSNYYREEPSSEMMKSVIKALLKNPHLKQINIKEKKFFTLTADKKGELIEQLNKVDSFEDLELQDQGKEMIKIY